MKLNKLFFGILGMAVFALAACTSDDDYTPATVSGMQVYFGSELGETFEIDPNASVTNLPIRRVSTSGSYTTGLKVTLPDNSIYTIPSSVTFADGEAEASIPISYDPAMIVRGDYEDVTIQILDSLNTTPFGISTYSFKLGATAWSDWKKWNDNGTATYTYVNYWSGDDADLTFLYRQSSANPNLYQFKIGDEKVGVMYGIELVLNWDKSTNEVTCEPQFSGYTHSSYGALNVTDSYNYWNTIRNEPENANPPGTFDEENGYIYIPLAYYVSAGLFGDEIETITIGGYDRKDLSVDVAFSGKYIDAKDNYFIVSNVTLGSDVSKAYVALLPGTTVSEDVLKTISDKSYSPMEEITESGEVRFAASDLEDGDYSIVVVPFFENEVLEPISTTFTFATGSKEIWNEISGGIYAYGVRALTENAVSAYFGTVEAVLYQSSVNQNRYKIAPWGGEESKGLIFNWNRETNIIVADAVYTGDDYIEEGENYGSVYFSDIATYAPSNFSNYPSRFDPEKQVFEFWGCYHFDKYWLGAVIETFTLFQDNSRKAKIIRKELKLK